MNITLSDELYASLQSSTLAMNEAYKEYMACPTNADSSLALTMAREYCTVTRKAHERLCVNAWKMLLEGVEDE